jgi:riboflavin kinase, archaea type
LPQIEFEGTVFSGKGEGKNFVSLPWVTLQIEQKLGFTPYNGTLNIRLNEKGKENRQLLDLKKGITLQPQTGYCPGIVFRASISGFEGAIVMPVIPSYPCDVIEVISPLYLRGKLCLTDGKKVNIWVTVF